MVIVVRIAIGNPPGSYLEERGGQAVYFEGQAGNALQEWRVVLLADGGRPAVLLGLAVRGNLVVIIK